MSNAITIVRWELFKLVRRRMTWILLGILFAFTQLAIWGAYLSYTTTAASGGTIIVPFRANVTTPRVVRCNDLRSNPAAFTPAGVPPQAIEALVRQCQQQQATQYRLLSPTRSLSTALGITSTLGLVLLGILSAAAIGIEYGLGTLRPILVRGTGRLPYLAGKYLTLVAATTAALLLVTVAAAGSGLLVLHLAAIPPAAPAASLTGLAIPGVGGALPVLSFADVVSAFARTWASLIAFMTMAGSITILTRSTAAGMALSLGYYVFEAIFIRLMSAAFSWFETVGDYLPMRNINALGRAALGLAPGGTTDSGISTMHASLVVAGYVILFAGLASVVFRRRDIVGASGG